MIIPKRLVANKELRLDFNFVVAHLAYALEAPANEITLTNQPNKQQKRIIFTSTRSNITLKVTSIVPINGLRLEKQV